VSLRRRKEDLHKIPAEHFMSRSAAITPGAEGVGRAAAEALAAAGRKVMAVRDTRRFECVNFVGF
jgi:NAD(P)-dependent dehydrogenase (short-subunit alcohol dehydrogenase family)